MHTLLGAKKFLFLGVFLSAVVLLGASCKMPVGLKYADEPAVNSPAVAPATTTAENKTPAREIPTQQPGQGNQDTDGDGYGEPFDNCPGLYNPTQQDTDRDGKGDACEPNDPGRAVCSGDCVASETLCMGADKHIVRDTTCMGANPVCCFTGQVSTNPPTAPTCSGQCVASETSCMGAGMTIVRNGSCSGAYPVCCEAEKPMCGGTCIPSETGCYGTGKRIVRDTGCSGANPVCCVTQ